MLLAIDTSAGTAAAVVDDAGHILAERSSAGTRGHAELIGRSIQEVLDDAGLAARDISAVAVGMGPGPFTGLRVGIAAARAFAFGVGGRVIPVASHDAVAFAAARSGDTAPLVVVTDARRREIAWSSYDRPDADGFPVRLAGPELAPADTELAGRRVNAAEIPAGALGALAAAALRHGRQLATPEPLYLRAPDVTLSTPKRVTG